MTASMIICCKKRLTAPMPAHGTQIVGVIRRRQCLLCLALAVSVPYRTLAAAGPAPVDLKSSVTFAILAGSTITCAGSGIVNGDVGVSPGSSVGIPPASVSGTIHNNDATAAQAQIDLTDAYNDAAGRSADRITKTGSTDWQTLAPGLYWFASSMLITGDLTLDAGGDTNAVWIFQIGTTLTTAAGGAGDPHSRIMLNGGAQARNIFWQVGSSATLGTYSVFKGTIMAQDSITMDTDCTLDGRALARSAAVTYSGAGARVPTPEVPRFIRISVNGDDSVTVVLTTTPYFLLTLEDCPDLLLTNWTTLATDTPVVELWSFTDGTATASVTQRFYRAFITTY